MSWEISVMVFFTLGIGFLLGRLTAKHPEIAQKSHAPSPYRAVRHAYPMDYQMRRRMVMQDITSGKLSIDEAKQYLDDHTLSVNDYKCAVSARKQLEDFDRFVKWFEEYAQSNDEPSLAENQNLPRTTKPFI